MKERKAEIMVLLGQNSGRQIPPIARLGRGEYEPSSGQRQLWFLDRLDPDSSAYNISLALRLTGTIDCPALERPSAKLSGGTRYSGRRSWRLRALPSLYCATAIGTSITTP